MALHGPIMVNGVAIAEWGAQRMVTGDYDRDVPQPYWAEVYHHGVKVWEGDIAHTPSDGRSRSRRRC